MHNVNFNAQGYYDIVVPGSSRYQTPEKRAQMNTGKNMTQCHLKILAPSLSTTEWEGERQLT